MTSQLSDAFHSCPSQLEEQEQEEVLLEDDESDNESQALLSPVNELTDDDGKVEETKEAEIPPKSYVSAITATNNNNHDTTQEAVTDLWNTLYAELNNVGKSMSCPLCLSTYQNPVLLPCVHAFCRCCIQRSFADGRKKCPICNQTATKRSLVDAPSLQNLATAYKHVLRSFGMTPIVYDPDFVGLTQLPPEEEEEEEKDHDNDNQDTTHSSNTNKNKAPSLLDCHTHLEVSKTWHRVLSTTTKKQNTSFLLKEQERVLKADEKALVRAAVRQKRQRTKLVLPPPDDDDDGDNQEEEDTTTTIAKKNPTMVSFATDTTMIHAQEDEHLKEKGGNDDNQEKAHTEMEKEQPQQVVQKDTSVIVEEQIGAVNQASESISQDKTQQNQGVVEEKNVHGKTKTTTTFKTPEPLPPTLSQLLEESRDREAADQSAEEWMEEEQQKQKHQTIETNKNPKNTPPKAKQNILSSPLSSAAGYETAQSSLAEPSSMTGVKTSQQLQQQSAPIAATATSTSVEALNAINVTSTATTLAESQASLSSFQTAQPLVQGGGGDSSNGVTIDSTAITTTKTTTAEGDMQSVAVPSFSSKPLSSLPDKYDDSSTISSKLERVQNNDDTNSVYNIVDNDNICITNEKETVERHSVNSDICTTAKEQATDSKSSKPCPPVEQPHEMFDFEPNMDDNDDATDTITTALSSEKTTRAAVAAVSKSDSTINNCNGSQEHENQSDDECDSLNKTDKEDAAITPSQDDGMFAVGTVVQVQARTWPGVNKQGGVGRITKVHVDDDGGGLVSYDVTYVLGGREKKVDATFVKLNETNQLGSSTTASTSVPPSKKRRSSLHTQKEDNTSTATAVRGRKSRRITITTQKKERDEIPPELLAELAAAGFDTKCMGVKNKSAKKATSKTISKTTTAAKGKVASKDKTRAKQKPKKSSSTATTKSKHNFGLLKRQNNIDNQDNNAKTNAKQPAKKRTKAATSLLSTKKSKKVQTKTITTIPTTNNKTPITVELPPLTDSEKCKLANERYHEYISNAMQTSVINVVSSGLSEQDNDMLQVLCKQTKKSAAKVKLAKEFHPQKTTICVVPVELHGDINEEHAMSRNRTLKVMRAQLAGIPIVPPAWVTLCIQQEKVVEPTSSMYIRTLPTKTEQLVATAAAGDTMPKIQLGVANHAARIHQLEKGLLNQCSSVNVLENVFVFLCGKFDASNGSPRKADVTLLLREAGATILSSNAMVNKKLKSFSSVQEGSPPFTLIMLCDASTSDAQCGLSDGLAVACKKSVRESENFVPPGRLLVVNSPWLFDSISCGTKVTGDAYEPCSPRCKELWTICQAKTLVKNNS